MKTLVLSLVVLVLLATACAARDGIPVPASAFATPHRLYPTASVGSQLIPPTSAEVTFSIPGAKIEKITLAKGAPVGAMGKIIYAQLGTVHAIVAPGWKLSTEGDVGIEWTISGASAVDLIQWANKMDWASPKATKVVCGVMPVPPDYSANLPEGWSCLQSK